MGVRENLIAARALITDPMHWGRGALINHKGCLCALGAVGVARSGDASNFFGEERDALIAAMPRNSGSIASFNDEADHADILALFDRAIASQPDPGTGEGR